MGLLVFGFILVVIAAAFAMPVLRYGDGRVDDADAIVLAATILSAGLGILNFGFLAANVVLEDVPAYALLIGLAPVAAAVAGGYVVLHRLRGSGRILLLALAAVLTLAGLPAYFAFAFAAFVAFVTAVCYLLGIASPIRLFKTLDPRN